VERRRVHKTLTDKLQTEIKAIILRESEDFFDEPEDLAVLEVTIRIACDFHEFLKKADGTPEYSEADYMVGTIRCWVDEFFTMAQWGRILSGLKLHQGYPRTFPADFTALKESYCSVFEELLSCDRSAKAVGLLLSLVQLMLVFLTAYFPLFASFDPDPPA
jgi:hypothetical protein